MWLSIRIKFEYRSWCGCKITLNKLFSQFASYQFWQNRSPNLNYSFLYLSKFCSHISLSQYIYIFYTSVVFSFFTFYQYYFKKNCVFLKRAKEYIICDGQERMWTKLLTWILINGKWAHQQKVSLMNFLNDKEKKKKRDNVYYW